MRPGPLLDSSWVGSEEPSSARSHDRLTPSPTSSSARCRLSAICQQNVCERGETSGNQTTSTDTGNHQKHRLSRLNVTQRHWTTCSDSGVQVPPPTPGRNDQGFGPGRLLFRVGPNCGYTPPARDFSPRNLQLPGSEADCAVHHNGLAPTAYESTRNAVSSVGANDGDIGNCRAAVDSARGRPARGAHQWSRLRDPRRARGTPAST